ncbi:N-acetyltransferase [Pseudomonas marincola]|uniref:N-acetyltransferase n=1 Tax=Pseudomonas marincola TaxID=437900 RepID=UPI0008F2F41C|nr:N-acetyltransferase [Pseudomonas marincola]SFU18795.1 Predicted acetyltransferase, GNAT superfamily [Pseudomonas marincola]
MQFGIKGQPAPELRITDWVDRHGQPIAPFRLSEHAGKVRVIYCFQAWCPGCHSHGFPTLQSLITEFKDQPVVFAVVQSVFEGHRENGPEKRAENAELYQLDLPFGQDDGLPRPTIMSDYRTGGTPWFIVIDRNGVVVANNYRPENLAATISAALDSTPAEPSPSRITVSHNPAHQRFEVDFGDGASGQLIYRKEGQTLYLTHTEVPANRRGEGLGAILMEHCLEAIEKLGYKVVPVCSYTRVYLIRAKRWAHLLAKG